MYFYIKLQNNHYVKEFPSDHSQREINRVYRCERILIFPTMSLSGSRYGSRRKCSSRQHRGAKFTGSIVNHVRGTVKLRNLPAAKFHRERTFRIQESLCVRGARFSLWKRTEARERKKVCRFVQRNCYSPNAFAISSAEFSLFA